MMAAEQREASLPFDTRDLRGSLRFDEPMSRHTSWRVGGPADYFYVPADKADVVALMQRVPSDLPVLWLGLGSNLLVRDRGFDGLVIKTVKALGELHLLDNHRIYAEAGVTSSKVARRSLGAGLAGAAFLAGVPGSFGGALAMNAGAFGGETWPLVETIECVDRQGAVHSYRRDQIEYGYRRVDLPRGMAILSAVLSLKPADQIGGEDPIRDLLERRSASQPIQSANAGSVFKNPEGNYAARIIEQLGLKGRAEGGARFSGKHANFIVNEGDATALDIETLIRLAKNEARSRMGVELEPEVRIVGRPS
jgi:UDP-N-acetylmuramate dehydrogenase